MTLDVDEQLTIRKYLLGELSLEAQQEFELRLITEDEFYEEILITEDEIMDEYVSGTLSDDERQLVESHFLLSPERRLSLTFATALRQRIANAKPTPGLRADPTTQPVQTTMPNRWLSFGVLRPSLGLQVAAVFLVVIALGAVFLIVNRRKRELSHNPQGQHVLLVVLNSENLRGAGGQIAKFSISADTQTVQLQIPLSENRYERYESVIQAEDRTQEFTKQNLAADISNRQNPRVIVSVAADLLAPGDYRLKLDGINGGKGVENVDTYYFRVLKR